MTPFYGDMFVWCVERRACQASSFSATMLPVASCKVRRVKANVDAFRHPPP